MRALKLILAGVFAAIAAIVAIAAGAVAAAVVAAVGLAVYFGRRLLGRGPAPRVPGSVRGRPPVSSEDAIEVTATELPASETAKPVETPKLPQGG